MKKLLEKIKRLSPELRKEVEDFVEFLEKKYSSKRGGSLEIIKFRGALQELGERYTSVELQHKILEFWEK